MSANPESRTFKQQSWSTVLLEELTPLLSRRVISGAQAMVAARVVCSEAHALFVG